MPQHQISLKSHTGRVHLVPPRAADDNEVSILRSHPETRRYLRFLPEHISVEQVRTRRESRSEDTHIVDFHIHVVDSIGNAEFAGMTGIFNIDEANDSCEAGLIISPTFYRIGLGTDVLYTVLKFAFEDRRIHRVTFETGVDNVGMRGWLENVAEARLEANRRECWKEGPDKYSDAVSYSILEGEWREKLKGKLEGRLEQAICT